MTWSVSFLSISAMIALIGADHVVGYDGRLAQGLLGERPHRVFHFGAGAVGLRLELLLQQRRELIGSRAPQPAQQLSCLCFSHVMTPVLVTRSVPSRRASAAPRATCSSAGSFSTLRDQLFGAGLAVHVGDQVRKLRARLEQLVQRIDLAGDRRGREVVHALERDVDRQVALAGQRVRHAERDARLHRLHALVEIVDVDVEELALVDGGSGSFASPRQVGHDAHDERDLHLLLRAVQLDVVFDLHARRAVARDEFLTAGFGHRTSPPRSSIFKSLPVGVTRPVCRRRVWPDRARRARRRPALPGNPWQRGAWRAR